MKSILAVGIVIVGFASFGCGLPSSSSIPPGIYSGRIEMDFTSIVDGVTQQGSESRLLTIVFDEDGRFLAADGAPFLAGKVYFLDVGIGTLELFLKSITAIDNTMVLQFDLTVHFDIGTAQIEMTGQQTETITFDAATDTLTFVRTMQYAGIGSDGTIVAASLEGIAVLDRG